MLLRRSSDSTKKAFEDATYSVGAARGLQPTQFQQDRYIDVVRHVTL